MNGDEREFARKATQWFRDAYAAINAAGGDPELIVRKFSDDLLETMIRNNIRLVYIFGN